MISVRILPPPNGPYDLVGSNSALLHREEVILLVPAGEVIIAVFVHRQVSPSSRDCVIWLKPRFFLLARPDALSGWLNSLPRSLDAFCSCLPFILARPSCSRRTSRAYRASSFSYQSGPHLARMRALASFLVMAMRTPIRIPEYPRGIFSSSRRVKKECYYPFGVIWSATDQIG